MDIYLRNQSEIVQVTTNEIILQYFLPLFRFNHDRSETKKTLNT